MTRRAKDQAGSLAFVAYETIARALRVGIDALNDQDEPTLQLSQVQEIELWTSALACVDGTAERIRSHLEADELLSSLRMSPEAFFLMAHDDSRDPDDPFADNDDWSRAA